MDTSAIIMMALYLVVIWGGLIVSIIHFIRHPESPEDDAS